MKLKIHFSILLLLFASGGYLSAQKTVRVNAVKANDYGVIYTLPKTSVVVKLKVKQTTYQRGEFYQYSQRYLSLDPVIESKTEFALEDVMIVNRGVPDTDNSYMVTFKANAISPFVSLTEDGLIAAINTNAEIEAEPVFDLSVAENRKIDPTRYLTEETLRAGSTAKRAELVSKQIFELRQSRNDILTGEADNMPPDGEAYKVVMEELNTQEKALTEMFTGHSQTRYLIEEYVVIPENDAINKMVIGRFSTALGAVEADNLAGAPVYLTLTPKAGNAQPAFMTPKEMQQFEKKLTEGVVYNVPAKADVKVEFNNRVMKQQEIDVVQFGNKDVLTRRAIDNKRQPIQVIFYPHMGAIKQLKE